MKKKIVSFLILLILTATTVKAQVKFPEYIEHNDPTKALVDQEQIRGHHWSVIDKVARDAVPADKREIGMLVTWIQNSKYVTKRFQGSTTLNVDWVNDLNWTEIITESDTITYADTAIYVKNLTAVDSISFNEINLLTYAQGNLRYDSATQSLQFQNDLPEFNHNLGYEHAARYFNNTGTTIQNGELLTPTTVKVNGSIVPTVRRAGNSTIDSIQLVGMATTTVLDQEYGVVTLIGPVNGLDYSAYNDGDKAYVGHNGKVTNINPEPPSFSLVVGQIFYADNDSGQIYMFPGKIEYQPSPHISADTSRINYVLPIITQNVFEYLPISETELDDKHGFEVVGDSVLVQQDGSITIALNLSYIGNAQSDVWRKGVFCNGMEVNTVSRSTTSTSVGNSTVIASFYVFAGDYLSFKMTNESAVRNPTISDLSWEIIYLHR
jgi:hypothetical protein